MAPTIKLNSGYEMPQVGFGLWKVDNAVASDVVYNAIKAGYRLFDGACGKSRLPLFPPPRLHPIPSRLAEWQPCGCAIPSRWALLDMRTSRAGHATEKNYPAPSMLPHLPAG